MSFGSKLCQLRYAHKTSIVKLPRLTVLKPLIFGGIVKVACGYLSDKFNDRSSFMMGLAIAAVIGYALQIADVPNPAKYFAW